MVGKILVIEDDPVIQELLDHHLKESGHEVRMADSGSEGLSIWQHWHPDLIILDLLLPDMHGYDVCRQVRSSGAVAGILMLTALDDQVDRVAGLELGADDYLAKPFHPRELMARIRSILRRLPALRDEDPVRVGKLVLDQARCMAKWGHREVFLTHIEFQILQELAEHNGAAAPRDQLIARIWNSEYVGDTRTIDVHIRHIRAKFEEVTREPVIETVRGVGYRLAVRS